MGGGGEGGCAVGTALANAASWLGWTKLGWNISSSFVLGTSAKNKRCSPRLPAASYQCPCTGSPCQFLSSKNTLFPCCSKQKWHWREVFHCHLYPVYKSRSSGFCLLMHTFSLWEKNGAPDAWLRIRRKSTVTKTSMRKHGLPPARGCCSCRWCKWDVGAIR